ncbi:hypothetical protein [Paenibacillus xylanexedens]|uniref:hypothetical protein n=1 Tax=Paenibacillus xylanexedens TaxID=528191 RepID=UPI0011A16CCB|nr:hypothetical protein [Paenibacillus xylanexedens]
MINETKQTEKAIIGSTVIAIMSDVALDGYLPEDDRLSRKVEVAVADALKMYKMAILENAVQKLARSPFNHVKESLSTVESDPDEYRQGFHGGRSFQAGVDTAFIMEMCRDLGIDAGDFTKGENK